MISNQNNIVSLFSKLEKESKKKIFAVADKTVTYSEVCDKVRRLASIYNNLSVKQGDSIVFSTNDDILASILFISLLRMGITAVFLDPETKPKRAKKIIELVGPKILILDEQLIAFWDLSLTSLIIPIRKQKKSIINQLLGKNTEDNTLLGLLKRSPATELPENINPSNIAYVLFTSGTTTEPKGVCISYEGLFTHFKTLSLVYDLNQQSKILNMLILSHADGIIQGPLLALYNGACWYRPFKFSIQHIEDIFDLIYRENISHFIAVPTILALLCRFSNTANECFQNETFKYTISCGAQLEPSLWKEFESKFGNRIINVYGLTETIAGGIFTSPEDESHQIGTIGNPVDCNVRITDENGFDVKPGETGELLIKGENVMIGYLKAPEATSKILEDGWLKTGDLAVQEESGCFRILGRIKSIIISGGMNINPDEVTEVLNTHPMVNEAVTFGENDPIWGERVVCAVSLKDNNSLSEVDLINFCRKQLEEKKIPSAIYFLDFLPKGRSGKIQQENLRKEIEQHKSRSKNNKLNSIETQLLQLASDCFKVDMSDISLDTSEEEIQEWDSLGHLSLVAEVEQTFAIQMTPAEVINTKTLRDIFVICNEKMSN